MSSYFKSDSLVMKYPQHIVIQSYKQTNAENNFLHVSIPTNQSDDNLSGKIAEFQQEFTRSWTNLQGDIHHGSGENYSIFFDTDMKESYNETHETAQHFLFTSTLKQLIQSTQSDNVDWLVNNQKCLNLLNGLESNDLKRIGSEEVEGVVTDLNLAVALQSRHFNIMMDCLDVENDEHAYKKNCNLGILYLPRKDKQRMIYIPFIYFCNQQVPYLLLYYWSTPVRGKQEEVWNGMGVKFWIIPFEPSMNTDIEWLRPRWRQYDTDGNALNTSTVDLDASWNFDPHSCIRQVHLGDTKSDVGLLLDPSSKEKTIKKLSTKLFAFRNYNTVSTSRAFSSPHNIGKDVLGLTEQYKPQIVTCFPKPVFVFMGSPKAQELYKVVDFSISVPLSHPDLVSKNILLSKSCFIGFAVFEISLLKETYTQFEDAASKALLQKLQLLDVTRTRESKLSHGYENISDMVDFARFFVSALVSACIEHITRNEKNIKDQTSPQTKYHNLIHPHRIFKTMAVLFHKNNQTKPCGLTNTYMELGFSDQAPR